MVRELTEKKMTYEEFRQIIKEELQKARARDLRKRKGRFTETGFDPCCQGPSGIIVKVP